MQERLMALFWFLMVYARVAAWTPPVFALACGAAAWFVKRRPWRIAFATAAFLVAAFTADALWEGALRVPDVVRREVFFADLPPALDGYSILQITDVHASSLLGASRIRALVKRANAAKPDVVCLTGDFVDGSVEERRADLEPLAGLRAPDGVWGVTGNHEIYSGYAPWVKTLNEIGVKMLDPGTTLVRRGDAVLALGGIGDMDAVGYPRFGVKALPSLAFLYADVPANAFRVLLQHRPVLTQRAAKAGVRLVLSGHTHGGQMLGLEYFVRCDNENHLVGWYHENGLELFVSPGAGLWAGFPYRFNARAEMTLVVLRRGDAQSPRTSAPR